MTGGPTTGQLKTSLSHLEYENEQLKTQVVKLKAENRAIEDRLVQEQIHNGDLTARLDDARNMLFDRGYELSDRTESRSRSRDDFDTDGRYPRPRTLPAGRSTRKPRKPPAAQIRGRIDTLKTPDDKSGNNSASLRPRSSRLSSRRPFDDDLDDRSFQEDQLNWLPVATGTAPPSPPRR